MKVFMAGATGVLGRRASARLVAAGHDVTAVARTPEKAAALRAIGARPIAVDLFDPAAVVDAVAGAEVVCNLATHIPNTTKAGLPGAWSENARIRTEASRNLVDAALAAGAQRYIQESIAFVYADGGDAWIDEDGAVSVASHTRAALTAENEAIRFTAAGGVGVALRFGFFHGPDSPTTLEALALARRGVAAALGAPGAYQAFITTDDAAEAVVAALEAPAGVYNVCDDEPLTRRQYADALATAVGRASLRLLPAMAAKAGGTKTAVLGRSQRVSNRRFVTATGWRPSYPSAREAWPAIVAQLPPPEPRRRGATFARLALAWVGAGYLFVGAWALVASRSFYDTFPGGGRHWVAVDGPFNLHLVRDFGALNLAIAVVLGAAVIHGGRALTRAAAAAALVWGLPHLVYHLGHLAPFPATSDRVANIAALTVSVVLPAAAYAATRGWSASD